MNYYLLTEYITTNALKIQVHGPLLSPKETRHPYSLPQENRIMKTSETPTIEERGAYQKRLISLGGLKLTG